MIGNKIKSRHGGIGLLLAPGPYRSTRSAVIERLGGCCCGMGLVERGHVKSRIETVTEHISEPTGFKAS